MREDKWLKSKFLDIFSAFHVFFPRYNVVISCLCQST
jgi:hypothetical protein